MFLRYSTLLVAALAASVLAQAPKPFDDIAVTGDVARILLCEEDETIRIYKVTLKLHVKNVGTRAAIVSAADGITDYYKFANTLADLKWRQYNHIGWVTSGALPDPQRVPNGPPKPFKVVPPNESIDVKVDFRAIASRDLRPGPAFVQVIAENWPDYTEEYIAKARQAWSATGNLWAHSLNSEPIAFVLPNLKQVRCP